MIELMVERVGPAVTIQDEGRPGHLAQGLSLGGAVDPLALDEAAALFHATDFASLEMAGLGGRFSVRNGDATFALTGARMRVTLDGVSIPWNTTLKLVAGQVLEIGAAIAGTYGYFHVLGSWQARPILGAHSAHLNAGIGRPLIAGDRFSIKEKQSPAAMTLDVADRFSGGTIRAVRGPQTALFDANTVSRFFATEFRRDARANRMGAQLTHSGAPFSAKMGLSILSEITVPGDIQLTGEGLPYVLGPECQTTGGYPRIATVIPPDLPKILQAPLGAPIRFELLDRSAARKIWANQKAEVQALRPRPAVRNPNDIGDLLAYQLISGVTSGEEGP